MGEWVESLVTTVNGLSYSFVSKIGRIDLPKGGCTDMSGCVKWFEGIDKGVIAIVCYNPEIDVSYVRHPNVGWRCHVMSKSNGQDT